VVMGSKAAHDRRFFCSAALGKCLARPVLCHGQSFAPFGPLEVCSRSLFNVSVGLPIAFSSAINVCKLWLARDTDNRGRCAWARVSATSVEGQCRVSGGQWGSVEVSRASSQWGSVRYQYTSVTRQNRSVATVSGSVWSP
jgi:hypothetical protein